MTSKGLFFKYMRENTKQRLWSVALTALLCFFLFPVLTALETSIMLRPDNLSRDLSVEAALAEAKLKLTNEMLNMYSIQNAMLVFILIVAAVVLAASGFSYLHSKKKTDFFTALKSQLMQTERLLISSVEFPPVGKNHLLMTITVKEAGFIHFSFKGKKSPLDYVGIYGSMKTFLR